MIAELQSAFTDLNALTNKFQELTCSKMMLLNLSKITEEISKAKNVCNQLEGKLKTK